MEMRVAEPDGHHQDQCHLHRVDQIGPAVDRDPALVNEIPGTRRSGNNDDQQSGALEFSSQPALEILESLKNSDRTSCVLLGGATAHDAFLQAGLVDEIWVTIEPRLFGQGTPVIKKRQDQQLAMIDTQRLPESDSLVIRYRVKK